MILFFSLLAPLLATGVAAGIAYVFAAEIAAGIVWVGGTILGWVAMLFDGMIFYTIVKFNTFIYKAMEEGVNIVWTVGRDISNIVIIGIFTFVAIMTILGSQSYGAKRLIARILVIAVLINFSLLFTRIIIEASNFVSIKFYYATVPQSPEQAAAAAAGTESAPNSGIATRFMALAGTPSFLDARETAQKVRDQYEYGFWMSLLYGISVFILYMAFAAVLAYAIILLAARTILSIFLLVTSSLAFGSHLIPQISDNYGWSAWWNALLRNALFAPLLLFMLWATLRIGSAFVDASGSSRSFDMLFTGEADGDGILALIFFMIILGMLFASIRIASSFANSTPGFSELKFGLGAALAVGARSSGFLGRAGIGRGAAALDRLNDNRLSTAKVKLANLENLKAQGKEVSRLQMRLAQMDVKKFAGTKEMLGGLAKSSFNAMNTNLGKDLVKKLGAGSLAGGKVDSFAARAEKQAKEAKAQSQNYALSDKEKNQVVEKQKELLSQQRESSGRQLAVAEKTLEAVRSTPEHKAHQNEEKAVVEEMKKISIAANKEITDARGDEKKIKEIQSRRDGNLSQQEEKIKSVRNNIVSIEKSALEEVAARKDAAAKVSDIWIRSTVNKNSANAQREAAARYAAGEFGSTNSTVANMARDLVKKAKEEKDEGHHLLKILEREMKHGKEGGEEKKDDH